MKKICAAALVLVLMIACAISVFATEDAIYFATTRKMTAEEMSAGAGRFADQLASRGKTMEKAYTVTVSDLNGQVVDVRAVSEIEITLDESDRNNEYEVWYLDAEGALRVVKTKYVSRSGDAVKVKVDGGTFVSDTDTLVLVKIGEKSTSVAIPITVGILTIAVAVGVVFFVLSKNKKESF